MRVVFLLGQLPPGDGDFFGVDDDHEIAGVEEIGKLRLVLSPEQDRHFRGQAAEDFPLGVDHPPCPGDLVFFWDKSLHRHNLKKRKIVKLDLG